ncbi:MAG: reverse transcriptase domain-containing protein [bacterium]
MTAEIMSVDSVRLTLEYLRQVRKPRAMSVQSFQARIMEINSYIPFMPGGNEGQKLNDENIKQVIENGVPVAWRRQQRAAHLTTFGLQDTVSYYMELQAMELEAQRHNNRGNGGSDRPTSANNGNGRNRGNNNNNYNNSNRGRSHNGRGRGAPGRGNQVGRASNRQQNGNGGRGERTLSQEPWCHVHNTNTHDISECRVVQNRMQTRSMTRTQAQGQRAPPVNNHQERYQTRTTNTARPTVRLPTRESRRGSPREENYGLEGNPQASSDDDESTAEFYAVRGGEAKNKCDTNINNNQTALMVKVVEQGKPDKYCRALLDSGATQSLIDESLASLGNIMPSRRTKWQTRGGTFYTEQKANIKFHFLELNSKQPIEAIVHVDNMSRSKFPSDGYEMIIGKDLMKDIGINLLFTDNLVTWGDYAVKMTGDSDEEMTPGTAVLCHPKSNTEALATSKKARVYTTTDESELTPAMQKALEQQGTSMIASSYDKHDYKSMVLNCKHLNREQQDILLKLFKEHAGTFSGRVDTFPGPPHHIKLKKEVVPYSARPYTIPRAYEHLVKDEINRLVDIGVLKANVASAWGSPTFAIKKKDGRIRIITDFRVVNTLTERQPHPILRIADIIQRMEGFTFATCLDLNIGYYHIKLDPESQDICTIVLPWGKYSFLKLPLGFWCASDIFQLCMNSVFNDMSDDMIYFDNNIVFTKFSFGHHVERLREVLRRLKAHDLHYHVESDFLASQKVDYLGYTLTPTRVQPQANKIKGILSIGTPKNRKELRRFIGFVNFYRDLWPRRSETLAPLAALTSTKAAFLWTDIHQKAFDELKKIMGKQILLSFPNFTIPFHVYTDASDAQLGSVIMQNNHPIAF